MSHALHEDDLRELRRIEQKLEHSEKRIMKAITDFTTALNDRLDTIDTAVTGIQGDVKTLSDEIAALQNSPGTLSPEDQSALDSIQSRVTGIADKLSALDALTPPATPPTP